MNYKGKVISLRKKFINSFKDETNYNYDRLASIAYCGDGFYVNKHNMQTIENIWCYDINWAYAACLINNKFPLSTTYTDEETELGIFVCKVHGRLIKRYADFDYSVFENKLGKTPNANEYIIILTNIDYEIFTDMYTNRVEILNKYYFKDVGYLPSKTFNLINNLYIEKKKVKDKEIKKIYEICIYGLNAKKLYNKDYFYNKFEYYRAYAITQYDKCRSKYTPIAMFQTSYIRYRMWNEFNKYKNVIKYMNTDSIHSVIPLPIKISNELGKFKLEYDGNKIQFIRRNAYVVFNHDGSIKDSVINGIVDGNTITLDELEKLNRGIKIRKHCYKLIKGKKVLVETDLSPLFLYRLFGEET